MLGGIEPNVWELMNLRNRQVQSPDATSVTSRTGVNISSPLARRADCQNTSWSLATDSGP